MVTSSLRPLPLVSFEPSLSERAIAVAIDLFSELKRGDRSSVKKAKEISKIFGLVLLPKESTMQVVNAKLIAGAYRSVLIGLIKRKLRQFCLS